jgi:dTDP-4-amino-4,6-dideoxygalactose transaminase
MKVDFLDLGATYQELKFEIDQAIQRTLDSGWYIQGQEVSDFEQSFAQYVGAKDCIGLGNGLDALHLALRAMGIGPGDEVIVPSNTYIATWLAVSQTGARPIPVEPLESSYNLDPALLEQALTSRTKAIIPVHLYGEPADLDPILAFARAHSLFVLEDAAQAHGAKYKGMPIGNHGHAVAWSFYPSKNLGAFGDAGAITTSDSELAQRIRILGNYGSSVKYINEIQGYNSRLDPIQAAILGVKLKCLDTWNERRQRIAQKYLETLKNTSFILPTPASCSQSAWHVFVIRTPQRQRLQDYLKEHGIQTLIHYPIPPHLQDAYHNLGYLEGAFPISERIHQEVISLPIGPHLSDEHVQYVIDMLLEFDSL